MACTAIEWLAVAELQIHLKKAVDFDIEQYYPLNHLSVNYTPRHFWSPKFSPTYCNLICKIAQLMRTKLHFYHSSEDVKCSHQTY